MEKRGGHKFTALHPKQNKKAYSPLESEVQVDVELNRPSATGRTDWTIRRAKVPGVLMVLSASLNLAAFITIGVLDSLYPEFLIAFMIYLTAGILALIGALRVQSTQVLTMGALAMSCIALTLVGAQALLRLFDLGIGRENLNVTVGQSITEQVIYWTHVVLLFNTFFTVGVCVALVVIGSKVICACCGGGDQGEDADRDNRTVVPGGEYESQVPFLSID